MPSGSARLATGGIALAAGSTGTGGGVAVTAGSSKEGRGGAPSLVSGAGYTGVGHHVDEAFGSGPVALQSSDSIDHKGAPTGPVALGSGLSSGGYSGAVAVRSGDAMGVAGNVCVVAGTASAGGGLDLEPGRSSPAFRSHHPRPSWGDPSPSKRAGTVTTKRRT